MAVQATSLNYRLAAPMPHTGPGRQALPDASPALCRSLPAVL